MHLASLATRDDNTTHSYLTLLANHHPSAAHSSVTFDPDTFASGTAKFDLDACASITVCDLTGVERFLVWAVRWAASRHEDPSFAAMCLQDSFDRAGMGSVLPVFRRYVEIVHGEPVYCPAATRLGCWRINPLEAHTLHALASLQHDRFGEAWHALTRVCTRIDAARAMLALGEIADALTAAHARIRPWQRSRTGAPRG